MTDGNDLELSFSKTLKESDLTELTAEITDKALEAAGNVPIVGNLYKMFTTAKNVSTYFYVKKIYKFLFELKDVPIEKRRQQIAKLEVLTEEREKVGEAILLLLDKLNKMNKATMVGKVFKAYLEQRISADDWQLLNYAIEQLNCANIRLLSILYTQIGENDYVRSIYRWDNHIHFEAKRGFYYSQMQQLESCGLVAILDGQPEISPPFSDAFRAELLLNKLGKMFVEIVLGVPLDANK